MSVKTNNTLWGWGQNSAGQLGVNTAIARNSPSQVGSLTTWQRVETGSQHTGAVKTDGTLWMWGSNGSGRLGDGTVVTKSSPVQIGSLTNWFSMAGGDIHSLANTQIVTN
jgi:alpha-tubulin suppressor-like RCC1 family protein